MTTFTKLGAGETPLIEVDARKKLSKIDPMTYGGFTEYGNSKFLSSYFHIFNLKTRD